MKSSLTLSIVAVGQLLFSGLCCHTAGVTGFSSTSSSQRFRHPYFILQLDNLRSPLSFTSNGSSRSIQFWTTQNTQLLAAKDDNSGGGGGDGGGTNNRDDGLNSSWGDDKSKEDEGGNFLDSVQNWVKSDDGKEDIKTYFISLFIALLLRFTIIEPRYIPSLSMYPTFEVGDQLAVEKVTKRIKPFYRNEVVVFNPPDAFRELIGDSKRGKEALIKRIVAVEGDKVEVRNGKLLVNGEQQDEPFTAEDARYQFGPVEVPTGTVLVLGDNRNQSFDGHIWGFLPKENVIGRAVFVYWPPWRIGNGGMY